MRPNVLLIMTDQQRGDCLGCLDHPVLETPNLDWLAANGSVFTAAYSPSPSCIPARASLFTGLNPWHTGILGMGQGQGPMDLGDSPTLPGELGKAGYHTQGVGKMHFHPQRTLNGFHNTVLDESGRAEDPGFVSDYRQWFDNNKRGPMDMTEHGIDWNSWLARPYHTEEHLHPTNWTVDESLRFLQTRDPTKPFFLMTSFARPHSPYDPPTYYFDLYRTQGLPKPHLGAWSHIHDRPDDAVNPNAWRGKRSDAEVQRARAGYYGSITHIDHQIGRLFQYLQKNQLWDNTIILFTSDHGDMLGDHNLWRKTYAYEGSARVPLIIRLPGKEDDQRRVIRQPTVLQDIMPTILEAAQCPLPAVDGRSLLPLLHNDHESWRAYVHGEHCTCYAEEQEMQFVTDGVFKYIWFPRLDSEQLFNLRDDPGECTDLAGLPNYQDTLELWRQRLVDELEPRDAGLTEGGRLVSQCGKPPLRSPHYPG